jgi:hypothetical protein
MKIAVVGSRGLIVRDLENYLPAETTEIVSGGARGVDICARMYAKQKGLLLKEFLPDYEQYGKIAPLMRNLEIIDYADEVYAFWDGTSRGTKFVIENCRRKKKKVHIFMLKNERGQ